MNFDLISFTLFMKYLLANIAISLGLVICLLLYVILFGGCCFVLLFISLRVFHLSLLLLNLSFKYVVFTSFICFSIAFLLFLKYRQISFSFDYIAFVNNLFLSLILFLIFSL